MWRPKWDFTVVLSGFGDFRICAPGTLGGGGCFGWGPIHDSLRSMGGAGGVFWGRSDPRSMEYLVPSLLLFCMLCRYILQLAGHGQLRTINHGSSMETRYRGGGVGVRSTIHSDPWGGRGEFSGRSNPRSMEYLVPNVLNTKVAGRQNPGASGSRSAPLACFGFHSTLYAHPWSGATTVWFN